MKEIIQRLNGVSQLKPKISSEGMYGFAKIIMGCNSNSKTIIQNLETKSPLLVQKALYLEPENPEKAFLYLMSSAGGILQGDKLEIDVLAKEKTNTCITTQAATKIFKSEKEISSQTINIKLEKNCSLEFLPKQIIPHVQSKFSQKVHLQLDKGAQLIYSEIISAGRIAHGENFDFSELKLQLHCFDENNEILFIESLNIEPENKKTQICSLFGNKNHLATIFLVFREKNFEVLEEKISKLLEKTELAGYSQLPNDCGIVVKILSNSIDEIEQKINEIVKLSSQNY